VSCIHEASNAYDRIEVEVEAVEDLLEGRAHVLYVLVDVDPVLADPHLRVEWRNPYLICRLDVPDDVAGGHLDSVLLQDQRGLDVGRRGLRVALGLLGEHNSKGQLLQLELPALQLLVPSPYHLGDVLLRPLEVLW
jgi:hypothetical protein